MFGRHFLSGPLLHQASGDGEGSIGGGTANPALDEKRVTEIVNSVLNGYAKRQEKEFSKFTTQFSARFDEAVSKLTGSGASGGDGNGTSGDGNNGDEGNGSNGKEEKLTPHTKARMDKYERDQKKLQERLDVESKAREEAANRASETERLSAIRGELSKYPILPDNVDDIYDLVKAKVKRDDDGQFVVGDTTMEAYISKTMERMPGVLRPVDKSGSGSNPGHRKGGGVQLEDIKPGASKELLAAARAEIVKLIPPGM